MSNDPTQIRRAEATQPIPPFEYDGLSFSMISGIRTVRNEAPGFLFEVRDANAALLGTVFGVVAVDPSSVPELGHVGVEIGPEWRGQGLPARFARGVIPLLREQGVDDILITCDPANESMKDTIRSLGAYYLDEWPVAGSEGTPKSRFVLRR